MNTWVLNFANTIVGVGVLAIPFCFHVCGIGIAVLMILATNVVTRKTCEYLLKAGQLTRKSGYESLAQHHLGPLGKIVTELGIIGLMLGTLISFQVVIGDLSPALISNALGIEVFIMSLKNIFSGLWTVHVNFWRPEGFFHCLPIISLAFSCQSQVFVMYEAIPEQSVNIMMDIINKAIHMVTVMYLSVGIFGYIAFYESGIRGDILANFPSGVLADAIKTGFWVSVIISFPLIIFPLRMSLYSLLFANNKNHGQQLVASAPGYIPQDKFTALTLVIVVGTLIVGILIPHIETVLSITGAVIGTFLCFVFPAALYILSTSKENSSRLTAKVIFVVGVICLVASTLAVLSANDTHMDTEHKEHPGHENSPPDANMVAKLAKPFQMPGNIDIKGPDKESGNIDRGKEAAGEKGGKIPDVDVEQREEDKKKVKMIELENDPKKIEESKLEIAKQEEPFKQNAKIVPEEVEDGGRKDTVLETSLPVTISQPKATSKGDDKIKSLNEAALVRENKDQAAAEKDDRNRIKSREIKTLNEMQEVVTKTSEQNIEKTFVNATSRPEPETANTVMDLTGTKTPATQNKVNEKSDIKGTR
eukprot:gene9212-16888_t